MFKNYLKIAWRNIAKNKIFSLLNVAGLTVGLLCSLLIYLWINDEFAINNYHENNDRLYSVYNKFTLQGKLDTDYKTPSLLSNQLKLKIPEIEKAAAISWPHTKTFTNKTKAFKQKGIFVDRDYLSMFSFNFLEGTATTALASPTDIVISRKMAEKFFGSTQNAIGKMLTYENSVQYQVSAVFENISEANTEKYDFYLHKDVFLKMHSSWIKEMTNFGATATFILLKEGTDIKKVETKVKDFLKEQVKDTPDLDIELGLQPYSDKYLYSEFENGVVSGGRIENVRIFSIIAFFILLIACINFMNLSSAGALKRSKEVGVRKVLGARKRVLINQFLGEAILVSLISAAFSLILLVLVLPMFNELVDKDINLLDLSPIFWLGVLLIALFTGLLSGSYPAVMMSSFRATEIFRKSTHLGISAKWIRKGLVVFQFALSIILITVMIITSQQISFIKNHNLGFDRQNVMLFQFDGELINKYSVFRNRALQLSGVESMTLMSGNPLDFKNNGSSAYWLERPNNVWTQFNTLAVGDDFVKTWGTEMLMGTDFSINNLSDNNDFIINEKALKLMGFENPIGKRIYHWEREGRIIGVMKDFHFSSIKSTIEPLIIRYTDSSKEFAQFVMVKINATNIKATINALQALHKEMNPSFPLDYSFLDTEYDMLYKSDTMFFRLSKYFSLMAIFISCLGLFGLVMFTSQQKIKEIGIRKVLGSSVSGITILLAKDFLKLVLFAIIIGSPIAWYFMSQWLANYQYKITMPWWAFILADVMIAAIAIVTLSFQSIKAATTNPIKSLRTE